MNLIITYPKEKFEKQGITGKMLAQLIEKHASVKSTADNLIAYYEGEHEILSRSRPDNAPNATPVCNHARDIADTASGYFMGNPITYGKANDEIQPLLDAYDAANVDDTDQDNALTLSITGRAYEYIYAKEDEAELATMPVDPRNTFIVRDESIEHNELFGVYYYYLDDSEDVESVENGESSGDDLYVTVYTADKIYEYKLTGQSETLLKTEDHYLGEVPIVEYQNNKYCNGDYEGQIDLIDAYNELMADRVNDKAQFVDAVLVLYGAILGDDGAESEAAMESLKARKLLELDSDARAEYLTRAFDESGVEILRQALKEDIYTMSHVPNLTDKNFAGNSSGVAMEYKLLGLEMLTKIKERYYRIGLRKRARIFTHYLGIKGKQVDPNDAVPTFSRGLPKNILELSQVIANLSGEVSKQTLISLLPFVEDPALEIEQAEKEAAEALKRQQEAMIAMSGPTANTPLEEAESGEIEETEEEPEEDENEEEEPENGAEK